MSNDVGKAALEYLELGFSVIPLGLDKRPMLSSWRSFQKRVAIPSQVEGWFQQWPDAGVGIVTGWLSRLVVVDLDSEKAVEFVREQNLRFKPPTVKTGKGYHLYYRYPVEKEIRNSVNEELGLDIRGNGGYVVAPPSMHPTGYRYRWTRRHIWNTQIPVLPDCFIEERRSNYQGNETDQPHWAVETLQGITEGGRNNACARLAGRYILKGLGMLEVLDIMTMWNERNKPPMPYEEVEQTVDSVWETHNRRKS